jgi:hypothetical protein
VASQVERLRGGVAALSDLRQREDTSVGIEMGASCPPSTRARSVYASLRWCSAVPRWSLTTPSPWGAGAREGSSRRKWLTSLRFSHLALWLNAQGGSGTLSATNNALTMLALDGVCRAVATGPPNRHPAILQ